MGVASGVATLDYTGKVPSSQLISDIVKGYFSNGKFYANISTDYVKIGNLWWAKGNIVPKSGGGYKIGNETDYGAYFSWGNIVPHFSSDGSTFDDGYSFDQTNYGASTGASLTADIASNDAAHDAALACLGGSARMPTKEEFQELYNNTNPEWMTIDGVGGLRFVKKSDYSVSVFFPVAGRGNSSWLDDRGMFGYYWSSSYSSGCAYYMNFDSFNVSPQRNDPFRYYGVSVRAVSSVEPFSDEITPEVGRLYTDKNTGKIYWWNGSVYVDLTNFYTKSEIDGMIDAQVKRSEMGVANGVATLDSEGHIDPDQASGSYPDLIAGNLFGETQTNDKFIFRPTAGIQDIESGEPPVGGGAVRKVEGNALAWNQFLVNGNFENNSGWSNEDCSISVSNNTITATINNGTSLNDFQVYRNDVSYVSGHKYLVCVEAKTDVASTFKFYINGNEQSALQIGTTFERKKVIYESTVTRIDYINFLAFKPASVFNLRNFQVFDLTLLFGSGNEPSTVEAFEQWLSLNVGLKDYYPYNAGELIPVKDYKVKSVGFNAFDKTKYNVSSTDYDYIYDASGGFYYYCKKIRLLPNRDYCVYKPESVANDSCILLINNIEQMNLGSYFDTRPAAAQTMVLTTNDEGFLYIGIFSGSTVSYQQRMSEIEICINLSYDDDKDGTYEPYEEHQVNIDVTKVYGKLNGSGDYVQVFPDGMKKAGSVADLVDLKNGVATVYIKEADLGNVIWGRPSPNDWPNLFNTSYFTDKNIHSTAVKCSKYPTDTNPSAGWGTMDKHIGTYETQYQIFITDSDYTDAEVFRTSLSGVYCYYELATPLTYTDLVFRENGVDIPVSEIKYAVDDYGTEEVLLGNDEEIVSCAPTMTIKYGINAADTIAYLPHDYVSCKPQSLVDSEQRTARNNIGAASQHDMDVVKKQLELIDKKVENDYWVDMGLPSGVLWAKRNIFTGTGNDMGFAPSEYSYDADYFSWGNTEGHIPSGTTFDYSFDATTYASTDGAKLTGNIPLSQDAARFNCGEPWRMPTKEEFKELLDNCDFIDASGNVIASTRANKLVTMSSCVGIRLKSKINGGILFFQCCGNAGGTILTDKEGRGYYFSAITSSDTNAFIFYISSGGTGDANIQKSYGFAIRPVM